LVKNKLKEIFDYRRQKVDELFIDREISNKV
jgi:hypothetical protein